MFGVLLLVAVWAIGQGTTGALNGSVTQDGASLPGVTILARPDPAAGDDIGDLYATPPTTVTYFFSDRGDFLWDDTTRTDLAVNYTLPISRIDLFLEGELLNAFNEQAQISGSTAITTATSAARNCRGSAGSAIRCLAFNPFTETPVQGTHWAVPATFGTATSGSANYQLPRTYRFSVGLRF